MSEATRSVEEHVRKHFSGHSVVSCLPFGGSRGKARLDQLSILRVSPGPRQALLAHMTVGCWDSVHDVQGHGAEFFMLSRPDAGDARAIELLTRHAFFHAGPREQRVAVGDTVFLGEPWVRGSACDHALISLPYPLGAEFEHCDWNGGHAHMLWFLPITARERAFKVANGVDALESTFEEMAVDFSDPLRLSVV